VHTEECDVANVVSPSSSYVKFAFSSCFRTAGCEAEVWDWFTRTGWMPDVLGGFSQSGTVKFDFIGVEASAWRRISLFGQGNGAGTQITVLTTYEIVRR
jgi:hypothetical protein